MAKVTAGGTLLPVGVCGVGAGGGRWVLLLLPMGSVLLQASPLRFQQRGIPGHGSSRTETVPRAHSLVGTSNTNPGERAWLSVC